MTREATTLAELLETQQRLLKQLPGALRPEHRGFLLSRVRAEPRWDLMPFDHMKDLPAIQWKLANLRRLRSANPRRFAEQQEGLEEGFDAFDRD